MIKYERERQNAHLGCSALRLIISTQSRKKSVYGVRRVTYLVNDGFLKPALIYRLGVFAL